MGVKLVSASGGSVEINPPATASNFVATMPAGTGTVAVQGASTNIVSGTAVASTSGTSIDFTGIPSWVKRITVMFNGVSTSGTSQYIIQLGSSGGVENTGYVCTAMAMQSNTAYTAANASSGIVLMPGAFASAAVNWQGLVIFSNLSSNTWTAFGAISRENAANTGITIAGSKTVSSVLDRVRITTANGTDTFDAGSINILYE